MEVEERNTQTQFGEPSRCPFRSAAPVRTCGVAACVWAARPHPKTRLATYVQQAGTQLDRELTTLFTDLPLISLCDIQ
jgi:hypothetical protein